MIHCWYHQYWDRYHWQWHCRKKWAWVLNRILSLSSMGLAINNVTNLCNFVREDGLCVWVSVYLDLLSHFLPFKIHVTNISPILIKMVDFKNMAWATSFATRASRKLSTCPTGQVGKKVIVIPCYFVLYSEFTFFCDGFAISVFSTLSPDNYVFGEWCCWTA